MDSGMAVLWSCKNSGLLPYKMEAAVNTVAAKDDSCITAFCCAIISLEMFYLVYSNKSSQVKSRCG